MILIKIKDEKITYPYYLEDLKRDFPNTSFAENLIGSDLSAFGVYFVNAVDRPDNMQYTKIITESIPELINGQYYQIWNVEDASQEYIEYYRQLEWNKVRQKRNALLYESDWTQLLDTSLSDEDKLNYRLYRQALRDITLQENPYDITYPERP